MRLSILAGTACAVTLVAAMAAPAQTTRETANSDPRLQCSTGDRRGRAQNPRLEAAGVSDAAPLTDHPDDACRVNDSGSRPEPEAHLYATSLPSDALPDAPVPASPAAAGVPQALTMSETYEPITGKDRLWWIFINTLGPQHLAGGVFSAAYGTAVNHPHEYGTHWGGFAERYGIRLTGVATSNVMEAGLGAIWGEDPRYFRVPEKSLGGRARSIIKQTFEARNREGNFQVAYARIMAITGSNFLSNTWRADSEADSAHAAIRTLEGFGGRLAVNAWDEFWPSIRARSLHK